MHDFICWLFIRKPLVVTKQLTSRDIQLLSDSIDHIKEANKVGDSSRIETATRYLRIIERKLL